jgi:hypothetical protein
VAAVFRSRGEVVLYRDVQRSGVWWIIPHVVVADDDSGVMLYTSPGAPTASPADLTEESFVERMTAPAYQLTASRWEHNHVLRFLEAGAAHAVELYWSEGEWEFQGWYVHLQTPFRRTPTGFDKRDQSLDLVVAPDQLLSWKDEHHLAALAAAGYFETDEVNAIRREADAMAERVRSWGSPFCDGWESWRPEPGWAEKLRRHGPV